jgi:uncharacterized membrane protein
MPSVNPGPATTQTGSILAVLAPQISPNPNSQGQGTNAIRLLAVGRSISVNGTGDTALLPIINSLNYNVTNIVVTNSQLAGVSGSIATANISVNTGAAVTGTSVNAAAALTTLTASNVVAQRTVVAATLLLTLQAQALYVNVGTAVATGTLDIFVYGYDLT